VSHDTHFTTRQHHHDTLQQDSITGYTVTGQDHRTLYNKQEETNFFLNDWNKMEEVDFFHFLPENIYALVNS